MTHVTSAIIVGGGIGGAATALSLARQGIKVMLLEKAHEIGEIGAGIQLGPNAFSALDSLGVGDVARQRAVFTDHITMMDAVNAEEVVCIETGQAFRDHFGGPYAVIHRVDIHATVWEAVLTHPGVGIVPRPILSISARRRMTLRCLMSREIAGRRIFSWAATALNRSCGKVYSATRRA